MIIVGSIAVAVVFVLVGWAIFTEMFQQRTWRRRVESGDLDIVVALLEEALDGWRRGRPPRGVPANLWAGVQRVQLVAVTPTSATLSTSAEGEFRTDAGRRIQVASALDEAIALAARVVDMILYDVPNLRLDAVRVDVYTTFTGADGTPVQRPILTTTAGRHQADDVTRDDLTPEEGLGRFQSAYVTGPSGQPAAIELPPPEGSLPQSGTANHGQPAGAIGHHA
jgi:hypothetical protein